MRISLISTAFLVVAATARAGPLAGTIDGVSYTWSEIYIDNSAQLWQADFGGSLVSAYSLALTVPTMPDGVTPYNLSIQPTYGHVTSVQVLGGSFAIFTLSGTYQHPPGLPYLTVMIGSNAVRPGEFDFLSLTDPPADAPEPASAILTGLGLFALSRARRWLPRRSKPA